MTEAHIVDVAGLDDGERLHVEVPVQLDITMDLAALDGPTSVEVDITRSAAGFDVKGEATARMALQCHRCLTAIDDTLVVPIDDLVTRDPDDGQPDVVDDRIDLVPIARDAVGLAIPLRPLCRDDCRGLCPVCGNDLNSDPCGGHDEAPANPFAVLEHLFDPE